MPKRPQPIKEIVVHRIIGGMLCIEIASKRAFEWVSKEGPEFGDLTLAPVGNETYASGLLVVSSCYDVDEIIEHLSKPEYVTNNVFNLVDKTK